MIEESAQVVEINDEGVWIETRRQSACGQCSVNKGCGTSVLSTVLGNKSSRMRVLSQVDVKVGDEVLVGMDESSMIKGALVAYLVPLLTLIIAAMLGQQLAQSMNIEPEEVVTVIFAVVGFWTGLRYLQFFSRRVSNDQRFQPVILRKLNNSTEQMSVSVEIQDHRKQS